MFLSNCEEEMVSNFAGKKEVGDDILLRGPQEVARDEWMTNLPPQRQASGPPAQHNTFFSKSEKRGRGDTSVWTDTPVDKAHKAKMQYLEAHSEEAAVTNDRADGLEEREKERAAKEAQLMDSYNLHRRSQSLLEKHQAERSAGGKTKKSKESGTVKRVATRKEPDWKVYHPWKPWDREKDIAAGRKSVLNLDPKNFKEGLSSRFGGLTNKEPRKFL